jgi:hypothetical protein
MLLIIPATIFVDDSGVLTVLSTRFVTIKAWRYIDRIACVVVYNLLWHESIGYIFTKGFCYFSRANLTPCLKEPFCSLTENVLYMEQWQQQRDMKLHKRHHSKNLANCFFPKTWGVNVVHNISLKWAFKSLMDVDLSRLLVTVRFEVFMEMKQGRMNWVWTDINSCLSCSESCWFSLFTFRGS